MQSVPFYELTRHSNILRLFFLSWRLTGKEVIEPVGANEFRTSKHTPPPGDVQVSTMIMCSSKGCLK